MTGHGDAELCLMTRGPCEECPCCLCPRKQTRCPGHAEDCPCAGCVVKRTRVLEDNKKGRWESDPYPCMSVGLGAAAAVVEHCWEDPASWFPWGSNLDRNPLGQRVHPRAGSDRTVPPSVAAGMPALPYAHRHRDGTFSHTGAYPQLEWREPTL